MRACRHLALSSKREDNGNVVVAFIGARQPFRSQAQCAQNSASVRLPIIFSSKTSVAGGAESKNCSGEPYHKSSDGRLNQHHCRRQRCRTVYRVAYERLERYQGGGAVLIEARPYRACSSNC